MTESIAGIPVVVDPGAPCTWHVQTNAGVVATCACGKHVGQSWPLPQVQVQALDPNA